MATALTSPEFVEACGPWDTCAGCSTLGHYCAKRGEAISCADLVARAGFDETDRPSPGTACAACTRAGHMCPAKGMAGDYALCLPCGRGEICDQARSVEKMRTGAGEFELEGGYAIAECRTIEIADADRVVSEAAPAASAWSIKVSLDVANLRKTPRPKQAKAVKVARERKPRPAREPKLKAVKKTKPEETEMEKMAKEEAKTLAISLAPTMSVNAIVAKVGYHWGLVNKWLKEAGVSALKTPQRGVSGSKKKGKKAASKTPPTPPCAEKPATVGVQLTERSLDAFWAKCSLAEKARAFSAMFEAK